MSQPPTMPRRNLLKSLAALFALPYATRADEPENTQPDIPRSGILPSPSLTPYTWVIIDQLKQHLRYEVYTLRPTDEQARGRPVWADRTGRAFLVLSDVYPPEGHHDRP